MYFVAWGGGGGGGSRGMINHRKKGVDMVCMYVWSHI